MLAKFASVVAHRSLAKLIDLGAVPVDEQTAVARSEENGLQVIVIIAPYAGPARVHPTTLEKIAAMGASQEAAKCPIEPATPEPDQVLRDVERAAWKATGKTPVTVKALARLAGYAYNSHFRDAVRRLVDLGLVVRMTGGVKAAG